MGEELQANCTSEHGLQNFHGDIEQETDAMAARVQTKLTIWIYDVKINRVSHTQGVGTPTQAPRLSSTAAGF